MTAKEEAEFLMQKFKSYISSNALDKSSSKVNVLLMKKHSKICAEEKYNALREQLFNLRSCRVIESEDTYLKRIDELIELEKEVKHEIEKI